jgi:radical SAM superfamily enzyme YgiQ (UPF0313 family)
VIAQPSDLFILNAVVNAIRKKEHSMAHKILLAHPAFPKSTFWSFDRALEMSGRSATMPPLGLLTVASLFPDREFEFSLADENVQPITDEEILAADWVFASAMVVQQTSLERLVQRCHWLGTPVMVGGPLVSSCYEQLLERGFNPDVWFLGEAETLMPKFIKDLRRNDLRWVYAHVPAEPQEAAIRSTFGDESYVLMAALPDLSQSPGPRFDLLDLDAYHSMAVQASRGCPIGCEFCDIWVQFGRKPRTGPVERLLDQLDSLLALGWHGRVFIVDDNFIGNVSAARELIPALRSWQSSNGSPFSFSTEADVRLGDESGKMTEIRDGLVAAGFGGVFLGIETPSKAALKETGKQVNIARDGGDVAAGLIERVSRLQSSGLEVKAGFIIGFDHDPADIDDAMIDFIRRSGIPMAMVGTLGVLPGTALQARLLREGRYRGRLFGTQTHGFSLNYQPLDRTERSVLDQYARVLEATFGGRMEPYYERCETLMGRLPRAPQTGDRMSWRALRACALSFVHIRPLGPYLKFLMRTLLRRPSFVPFAVVLAAQGEHLHRLTNSALLEYRGRPIRTESSDSSIPSRPATAEV